MVNPLASLRQEKLRIDKAENASVAPSTERTLHNRTGPGVVVSVWMALGGGNAPALDGRLRVYYDGSPTASIDIDIDIDMGDRADVGRDRGGNLTLDPWNIGAGKRRVK
jgi:hypothetical protein